MSTTTYMFSWPVSVAQLDACPSEGQMDTHPTEHSFVEIDHEIFSIVILTLPLIQEEQLSVSCNCSQY